MAQPSSERERDRDRDRHRSSHHHHHRTISSTTLLLALSLILAVLAISLTLPWGSSTTTEPSNGILGGMFAPKRAQGLITREGAVALREAEVARREAELLAGSPVGIAVPTNIHVPAGCPPGTLSILTQTVTIGSPMATSVEVVEAVGVPQIKYIDPRVDNLFEREQRVGERERDVGSREEVVGKRESDAARREQWIMDQLVYVPFNV
jgi:hypothetical protein